ncbi:hypothetical protein Tco_0994587 [Tanacetum coccineum]
MVNDMLKAQSKVINILCNLELIYPPAFFDIMIHLVIHLPLEAIFDGPIRPRWMYPFERYMKKLKNYVRNKAKLEGLIAEGYVAKEALTFSSYYFWDVTTKFIHRDCDVDCPPPTLIWYVLHNSPEIDTYWAKFKSEFPNKDMKEEFPGWFGKQIRQRHVDNDPGELTCVTSKAKGQGKSLVEETTHATTTKGKRYACTCDRLAAEMAKEKRQAMDKAEFLEKAKRGRLFCRMVKEAFCGITRTISEFNLAHNLLSIGQLMSSGLVIIFDDGYCYIQDKRSGQRIAKIGMTTSRMFPLYVSLGKEKVMVVKAWKDSHIWHLRYDHLHLNGMKLLKSKDMVMGLLNTDDIEFCKGYVLGK